MAGLQSLPFYKYQMQKLSLFTAALLGIVSISTSMVRADVKLPRLISDGMILQRDQKIKIWGWASQGEKVSVNFNNKSQSTVTPASGKWSIELPAMKA